MRSCCIVPCCFSEQEQAHVCYRRHRWCTLPEEIPCAETGAGYVVDSTGVVTDKDKAVADIKLSLAPKGRIASKKVENAVPIPRPAATEPSSDDDDLEKRLASLRVVSSLILLNLLFHHPPISLFISLRCM
ncbi:hypothetical protein MKW98_027064 [Papaver atlanticum]|uniref:Uncharacterized protein n=1 Tax=Papaver atlanticum TaxID=357466 RepID=A0AAD4RWX6_9MAGN|nr:hypothetical protein MKW98_027064 [Papaver atlanticum]